MNRSDSYQLVKSSGSVGANYLEANNALGKKDFVLAGFTKGPAIEWKRLAYWRARNAQLAGSARASGVY